MAGVRERIGWLVMYSLSVVIGFIVLIVLYVLEVGRGMLYYHPHPIRTILNNARQHADEAFPGIRHEHDA